MLVKSNRGAVVSWAIALVTICLNILALPQALYGQQTSVAPPTAPIEVAPEKPAHPPGVGSTQTGFNQGDAAAETTPAEQEKARQEKLAELKKKTASAHKGLFFNNDFSYLCDKDYQGYLPGDGVKRRCLPWGGCYDIGGQYRARAHFEQNIRGLGLTGVDDSFLLHRARIYGNFELTSNIRFFAEMLDAHSQFEQFAPRPIEENRVEMQNLFIDARLLAGDRGTLTARIGRQELLYGAQRAVSPLDWANTRRTFEGVNLMWKSKNLAVDGFWTNPMRVDPIRFDSPDRDQEFMGVYSSYTGKKNQTLDGYYLRLLNRAGTNDFKYDTLGVRWLGSREKFLWDVEAAAQFGQNTDGSDHSAGAVTLGVGRKFSDKGWKPELWAYYDWASGDSDTGAGNGFHHNFPLAHKYLGFMDLFGRRNIEDINFLATMQPTKKLKLLVWYHYLFLATQSDTPYSVVMTPFNPGTLPASPDLGHEIDFLGTWTIGPRQKLALGYSHFFSGSYYRATGGVPHTGNASFFYTEWTINF